MGVAAPDVSLANRQPTGGRWIGAVMLGVGLVAGFAGGAAFVTQYQGDQSVRFPGLNRVEPEFPRVEVPPDRPVASQPGDDPLVLATSAPPRTTEVDAVTPSPEPLVTKQQASAVPVKAIAESPLAVIYVQSHPAGAEVYLDGQLITTTPFQLSDIPPGRHTIRIDLEGYRSWLTSVDLGAGARMDIAAALER